MPNLPVLTSLTAADVKWLVWPDDLSKCDVRAVTIGVAATGGPDSNGKLVPGTCLGMITASKLYAEYDDGLSNGLEDGLCVLAQRVNVSTKTAGAYAVFGGVIIDTSECEHYDAAFKTDITALIAAYTYLPWAFV